MHRKRTDIDKLAAAYLAGEGARQTDIAEALGLSQTVVSRMLHEARDVYWRESVQFLPDKVTPEQKMLILDRIGRNDLARRLSRLSERLTGRRGPLLRIFGGAGAADEREKMLHFARHAAPYIKGLFARADTCGVTWGGMLGYLVAALRELAIPSPWTERGLDIVPLSGEPLGDEPTNFSSSSLSHVLGELANGGNYNARYLGMVPAFIPDGFKKQDVKAIRRLMALVRSYVEIFGAEGSKKNGASPPLAERLDMILTSVGPADKPYGFVRGRLLETGKVTIEELKELIIGDIGGVCIPRPDLSNRQIARLQRVTDRWTGLKREHLEACAEGAAGDEDPLTGKPGVVVISRGQSRAEVVYEAVKLGLINQLVIDQELADQLEKISARDTGEVQAVETPKAV